MTRQAFVCALAALATAACAPADGGGAAAVDADQDGYTTRIDCDDTDPEVHPGAAEVCSDGVDQDCSGADVSCDCADADGDGHASATCGGDDCDDADGAVHPGADEVCGDGIDQDCAGGDAACAACEPGAVPASGCLCDGTRYDTGFCCEGGWQDGACGAEATPFWVTAYLATWELKVPGTGANWGSYTVDTLDWDAFTHLVFFATNASADGSCCEVQPDNYNYSAPRIAAIVEAAHAHGKPVLISVGGAGASGMTEAMRTPGTRATLVASLVDHVLAHHYDGIDLDIEESADWSPYLPTFAAELRAALDAHPAFYDASKKLLLTAAVYNRDTTWAAAQESFDQINVMTYDFMGTWWGELWHNNAARNVRNPDGSCAEVDLAEGNANTCLNTIEGKVQRFIGNGVDPARLGGGVDFGGWIWRGGLNLAGDNAPLHPRDRWQSPPRVQSLSTSGTMSGAAVETRYYALVEHLFPTLGSECFFHDALSDVPYVSVDNPGTDDDLFVTYQDAQAVRNGVNVLRELGVGGVIVWELGGGYLSEDRFPESEYPGLVRDELLQAVKETAF